MKIVMKINCDHCGTEINRKPSYVRTNKERNHKTYCSIECSRAGKRTGQMHNCAYCGKEVYKMSAELKNSKSGNVFCSKSCAASVNNVITKTGESNANWVTGNSSYSRLAFSKYKHECSICQFSDRSVLQVHHIDTDRTNNTIDNLIILCANHHCMVHYGSLVINEDIKSSREMLGADPITLTIRLRRRHIDGV